MTLQSYLVAIVLYLCLHRNSAILCPLECICTGALTEIYQTGNGTEDKSVKVVCQSWPSQPLPNATTHVHLEDLGLSSLSEKDWSLIPASISSLSLANNYISNITVPSKLQNLTVLSLHNNSLQYFAINNNASSLISLDLSFNSLHSLTDATLQALGGVQTLNISYNQLGKYASTTFQQLHQLTTLNLQGNPSLAQTPIELPNSLQWLSLRGCGLEIKDLAVLRNLTHLEWLDVSDNYIPILADFSFPPLPNLHSLYLNNCSVINITHGAFMGSFSSLHSLYLDHNVITDLWAYTFKGLHHLHLLSLCHLPFLEYIHTKSFSGLDSLQFLHICHNAKLTFINSQMFPALKELHLLDLGFNSLVRFQPARFQVLHNITINLLGNNLSCDCDIDWIHLQVQPNAFNRTQSLHFLYKDQLVCVNANNKSQVTQQYIVHTEGMCNNSQQYFTDLGDRFMLIGQPARLLCDISGLYSPLVTWKTPMGQYIHLNMGHPSSVREHPTEQDVQMYREFHHGHYWHNTSSYCSEVSDRFDRLTILQDGSLYIDYVLRDDNGLYTCSVQTPQNASIVTVMAKFDLSPLMNAKTWSYFWGFVSAASFFMLNLIYASISALARRCINQRRREAIVKLVANLEHYKTTQMARLRDNYNSQLAQIRDKYHQRLDQIRENYTAQVLRLRQGATNFREGASNKVDSLRGNYKAARENYHQQLGKLKDYSSSQLEQLRERYSNQVLKIRDYGSLQLGRFHHKYKLQQQHVMKLLDMMNMDNCRNAFDSECVKAESIILDAELAEPEVVILPSPIDSADVSDSEYMTAGSDESGDEGYPKEGPSGVSRQSSCHSEATTTRSLEPCAGCSSRHSTSSHSVSMRMIDDSFSDESDAGGGPSNDPGTSTYAVTFYCENETNM